MGTVRIEFRVVFFCDLRFGYSDMKNGMSDWIRPAITKWTKDTDIFKDVSQFF